MLIRAGKTSSKLVELFYLVLRYFLSSRNHFNLSKSEVSEVLVAKVSAIRLFSPAIGVLVDSSDSEQPSKGQLAMR